jgi:hypothetical protein
MKKFALAIMIAAVVLSSQAGAALASDDSYTMNATDYGSTETVKNERPDEPYISTEDLYNGSRHGSGPDYNVDPAQQHFK